MIDLPTTWFLLVSVLVTGYAVLDGFDLGVGILHIFARNDKEKRLYRRAIGPVWDGNEVWLLAAGGALFAAYPPVYATAFSGFYLAFMLLLFALIFRAVALEFHGQVDSSRWRRFWDWSFGLGSLVPALLLGVAVGNVLRALPITAEGALRVPFPALLNPYSLLVGLLSLVMFVMHGSAFLALRTEGELRGRLAAWTARAWVVFLVIYLGVTAATVSVSPYLFHGLAGKIPFWVFLPLLAAAVIYLPLASRSGRVRHAFLASAAAIAAAIGLAATSLYPRMLPSSVDPDYSLTVYNASSSDRTLTVMLIIALLGMPIVIGYTIYIYRVLMRRPVTAEEGY